VTGRVRYGKIVIEEGGQLSGEVEVGTSATGTATRPAAGGIRPVQAVG
jgi:cytoskeletal protein CcmA (bactofilin family)